MVELPACEVDLSSSTIGVLFFFTGLFYTFSHLWYAVLPDFFLATRGGRVETGCVAFAVCPSLPLPHPGPSSPFIIYHSTYTQHSGRGFTGPSFSPPSDSPSWESTSFTDNGSSLPCTDNGASNLVLFLPQTPFCRLGGGPVWRPRYIICVVVYVK